MTVAVCVAATLGDLTAQSQIPCGYEVSATIVGPQCGGFFPPTYAAAISPNGEYVVGYYSPCAIGNSRAFLYRVATSEFVTLPLPPGISTSVSTDVSDAGLIVGSYSGVAAGDFGYVYNLHTQQYIATLQPLHPDGLCDITGINAAGECCGVRTIGGPPDYPRNAFTWSVQDGVTDLGVMNGPHSFATRISDDGLVLGWTGTLSGILDDTTRGFIYQNARIILLDPVPNGTNSVAYATNNEEILIRGRVYPQPTLVHTFLQSKKGIQELIVPEGFNRTFGAAISDNGLIVGSVSHSSNGVLFRPCVWHNNEVALLHELVRPQPNLYLENGLDVTTDGRLLIGAVFGNPSVVLLTPMQSQDGDTNCDQTVNVLDLLNVISSWGTCENCSADFNQDNVVNVLDLLNVISNWGS